MNNEINKKNKIFNILIVTVFLMIFFTILMMTHSLGYQTNDDIIMSSLISGKFTGDPSIHAVFMMFPLTLLLKLLYMLCNTVDWYAIVLVLCQMLFYGIAMYKIISKMSSIKSKIITLLISSALITTFFKTYLIFITFTEVSIFIMICILIYFLLSDNSKIEQFILILGVTLAFTIRKDGCLMLLPVFLPIGLYKSYHNKEKFKECLILGCKIALILVAILSVNYIIDYATGWKEYNDYNKMRSKYYDYYEPLIKELSKDQREELYRKSGITEFDLEVIDSYYLGLNEDIENKIVELVKNYESDYKKIELGNIEKILYKIWNEYKKELIFILTAFLLNFLYAILKKQTRMLLFLLEMLIIMLTICIYIVFKGRIMSRVMVPLFLAFISLYFVMLFFNKEIKNNYKEMCDKNIIFLLGGSLLIIITIANIIKIPDFCGIKSYYESDKKQYQYYKEHKENFYLQDVSGFDNGERKIHFIKDNSEQNYMTLGDWIAFSPAYYQKIKNNNVNNFLELCLKENVYIVISKSMNVENSKIWKQNNMRLKKVDAIDVNFGTYYVYKAYINKEEDI